MRVVNVIHKKTNNFISHMTLSIHSFCCKPDIHIGFSPNIKTNPLVLKKYLFNSSVDLCKNI